MKKEQTRNVAEELTGLLIKLGEGRADQEVRRLANTLIAKVRPDDLARAERQLLDSGLSLKKVQQLSASFVLMGVLDSTEPDLRRRLPDNHILRVVMAEHELLRCFLADLEDVNELIQQAETLSPSSIELLRLGRIAEHLNTMDQHLERENDVLFPALRQHGWDSLFTRIQSDHVYLKMAVNDLIKVVTAFERVPLESFKARLASTVKYLCPMMREHLFHEDRVLFPLAVAMVDDEKVWQRLKTICNEIGYCVLQG